ncbi:MAG: Ras GTPase activating protein ira2, partial [Sporothrix epigloea]
MNGNGGPVSCLVERLATRLPHRTGAQGSEFSHDEIVVITRTTLVKVSASSIVVVLDALLKLLEELGRPHNKFVASHPPHVILSELYILALLADCCSKHWEASLSTVDDDASDCGTSPDRNRAKLPPPIVLDTALVRRVFDAIRVFMSPTPDGQLLSAKSILDNSTFESLSALNASSGETPRTPVSSRSEDVTSTPQMLDSRISEIEGHVKTVVEYVTASTWLPSLDYLKTAIHRVRAMLSTQVPSPQTPAIADEERSSLAILRLVAYFWVDRQRLGQVLQELCSSFLHFRKVLQNSIAVSTPLLIIRWIERFPQEFVELHVMHLRVNGTPETLFDMVQTVGDNVRRKVLLYPLQTTLLFLLPDVFEVASNMREMRGGGVAKKVAYLESLRKLLRNKNEQAALCLVSLLRVARHFDAESDSALMSYAMDFQDEVREALFRRAPTSPEATTADQDLLTAAFVSLAHLNFEVCVDSLAPNCLVPSAPESFKIAVIQACSHLARLENSKRYEPLFETASAFVQFQMRTIILEFLNASPMTLFEGEPDDEDDGDVFFQDNFESFLACMVVEDETVRRLAMGVAPRLFTEKNLSRYKKTSKLSTQKFKPNFWKLTSLVLTSIIDNVSPFRLEAGLNTILGYLESRLALLKSVHELSELPGDVPERTACSTKLETLFLVSLCSSDIETCQLVISCIAQFLEECRVIDTACKGAKSSLSLLKNGEVFREISSKEFRFTGPVAFQRRVNGLLRKMQYPSSGILSAWEAAFYRWLHLSKEVSTSQADTLSEKTLIEWRNHSGFIASLGGICTAYQASMVEAPTLSALRWIDRASPDTSEEPLLSQFLRLSMQLLTSSNVRVRETMREILSSEISPTLYQALFKTLDSELEILFAGVLDQTAKSLDREVAFAEQSVALLRALVERLDSPSDLGAASTIHLGALALNFAKFLDTTPDSANNLRVKIKTCQLCEAVTKRKENLNLRDDVRIRNQLLEIIFAWIARPHSSSGHNNGSKSVIRQGEAARVQNDLDKACLKCLAELTYRLPLQPSDGHSDAGTSELKSHMFHAYFNRFLSLLNTEQAELAKTDLISGSSRDEASASELSITILTNLLSANLDVGLKRSLSIGYHDNIEIRTAFIRVLCNILMQGTEFSNLSDAAVGDKYEELVEILTNDISLATAMAAVCPSSEVDELTISLLNVFESRGQGYELLEAVIKLEVEETENESELLRRTCVATKMLSVYAKWKGSAYLKATLQKVVERLMMTSKDLDFELDPTRAKPQDELKMNAVQLQIVAKVFIDDIITSSSKIPTSFRKICNIISTAVTVRFPEARYTAVGAFIFLRFFCPAIVAPEVEGLVSTPPSKEMRRGLLLIAKIIQNLANNVLFGAKEPYMFPLNEFLSYNIYDVTTFLREISVAPEAGEGGVKSDITHFGAAVSLHRYLYSYWDNVQQRLISQGRRDHTRSPGGGPRARSPALEPLKSLVTNLGPPPLAVTWNRPQITLNSPPSYARFQNFMLRSAFKSNESFVTARAIYDGGESKDGVSIICIILRNIDADAIDLDTLIFCYLKIASRLWHKPFGLFVDATCYGGQNEPQDDLLQKLEAVTPTELSRQLSRVYIYNMNSTFRKCFRRVLRAAAKNEGSAFHPGNVQYHLVSNMQDLQAHFHLSQVHLPKETLSVVNDIRYVFQSITRLSRSRGKIDVSIKVGSQYVQITTTKKQEIHQGFGLNAIFNDIFRLGDIDEAPMSLQADDESAFGLRAENGKIVMYFTSPAKQDIIQAIRSAKVKYSKDARTLGSFERLVRPQDVPGTLLNLSLANLGSADHTLRLSSYNLLGALCRAFKFSMASSLLCTKDISVPLEPSGFIVDISRKLAETEPQLTNDFLNEFFVGWDSFSDEQKPLSLAYMAPWIAGLRTSLLAGDTESDKAKDKISALFRKLIEVAVSDQSLSYVLQQTVWPAIYQDETLSDLLLEEVVKNGLSVGIHGEQAEILTSIVTGIGTITIRGKVISRLRKALNRSSLRPTKHLSDNAVWVEICVLLQFCVSLSFDSGIQSQLYLPEIFHIVTMLANTGGTDIRRLVHRLLANSLHAVCTSFALDEARLSKLRSTLESLSDGKGELFSSHAAAALGRDGASISTNQDVGPSLAATESLTALLLELCSVAAPSIDIANAWRARWMSLVASTAFQNNPAVQPRAFAVMGCLAREEVDDDLLYQVLVALRTSIGRFSDDNNSDMMVAIVSSLSKMMVKLPSASRYGYQLFWLAVSLVRLVPPSLFNCTAQFLESVLTNISSSGEMHGERMVPFLLQGRAPLEDAALALDEAYGVHFSGESFHFAACACLIRGLTDTMTKSTALRVLSTFLELTSSVDAEEARAGDVLASPYMSLILARVGSVEDLTDSLWNVGMKPGSLPALSQIRAIQDVSMMKNKDLLLITAMELVDFQYLEDALQSRTLVWLDNLAKKRPNVVLHLCAPIAQILDDVLLHCHNSSTLEAAHELLQTLSSNSKFLQVLDSADMLKASLEDMGFGGLWRSCTFSNSVEQDGHCFSMTERLIE